MSHGVEWFHGSLCGPLDGRHGRPSPLVGVESEDDDGDVGRAARMPPVGDGGGPSRPFEGDEPRAKVEKRRKVKGLHARSSFPRDWSTITNHDDAGKNLEAWFTLIHSVVCKCGSDPNSDTRCFKVVQAPDGTVVARSGKTCAEVNDAVYNWAGDMFKVIEAMIAMRRGPGGGKLSRNGDVSRVNPRIAPSDGGGGPVIEYEGDEPREKVEKRRKIKGLGEVEEIEMSHGVEWLGESGDGTLGLPERQPPGFRCRVNKENWNTYCGYQGTWYRMGNWREMRYESGGQIWGRYRDFYDRGTSGGGRPGGRGGGGKIDLGY